MSILLEHRRQHSLKICFVGSALTLMSVQHETRRTRQDRSCPVCQEPAHECRDHTGIVERLRSEGFSLDPGRFEPLELPDPDDLGSCVEILHRQLTPKVDEWLARGPEFEVAVDFTGGTKCMSVALGLVARRWLCRFTYVGGTLRTKGGQGVVVSGKEKIVQKQNPWDALGFQTVEDALTLCDGGDYAAAARLLERASTRAGEPRLKRSLRTLSLLAGAFAQWDQFKHRAARSYLSDVRKSQIDLDRSLGNAQAASVVLRLPIYLDRLRVLEDSREPTPELIADLLANAQRRIQEERYDDGVARIYRAIEAIAQFRLRIQFSIPDTGAVPAECVPPILASRWSQAR